jgi:hypothetical protein
VRRVGIRRMFSLTVINTARFLRLPIDAQNLYFHLGLRADDDGIVEAFPVMRLIGSNEDNLKLLHAKEFVKVLNDDLVTFITDWTEHNTIRADRKIDSVYKNLLVEILPDVLLIEPRERADRKKGQPEDSVGTSQGQPKDGVSKVKLSKENLSKENLSKENKEKKTSPVSPNPKKNTYGEYSNILLTEIELEKLKTTYSNTDELIKHLDEYIEMKGYKAKSHYLAILKWVVNAVEEQKTKSRGKQATTVKETGNPFTKYKEEKGWV